MNLCFSRPNQVEMIFGALNARSFVAQCCTQHMEHQFDGICVGNACPRYTIWIVSKRFCRGRPKPSPLTFVFTSNVRTYNFVVCWSKRPYSRRTAYESAAGVRDSQKLCTLLADIDEQRMIFICLIYSFGYN